MAVTDFSHQAFEQPESDRDAGAPVSLRERLVPRMPGSPLWGWLGPLIVAVFGAFLRFYRLGTPNAVVFDETYYAKDAYSTIKFGTERAFVDNANDLMIAGKTGIFKTCAQVSDCAAYVVHPPLGKWMIGAGEAIFGLNPFGWRFAAALIGSLSIFILARVARRMTRSTLLGCLAGLLLSLDALHFVLSRSALLDIFLMFWILAGFACLVVDRDQARQALVEWRESAASLDVGPRLGWRPWRLAAGLCLGAGLATKWTTVFFIVAFAVMTLVWDAGARRAVGLRRPYVETLKLELPLAAAWMAVVPGVAYIVSFAGWFFTDKGWNRHWDQATSQGNPFFFAFDSLRSWISYQVQTLGSHTSLSQPHNYKSEPWSWPLLLRPVAFFYESPHGCGADSCSQAILGTGTPIIWYGGLAALIGMIAWYVATRDWRAGAVLLSYAVGWLPWFYYAIVDNRTMFLYYMIPVVPFMILAIVLACGLILGPAAAPRWRRQVGSVGVGVFALLALANFAWLYPVIAAEVIPYTDWLARMLIRGSKGWI
ncbi:dolichyl-phosphate-mannose--protein mannosyltransferase [Microtetraspora fusca]|uniref:dolichyl-phosphate-mannose--protein mannosyltransferase n=1 Tax=Microtetraspora fusca TaxID=1997 RepID=UPI000834B453|nr:phospholipid carrier-dependent glycosyltransferase [Microtetraspora fusca]